MTSWAGTLRDGRHRAAWKEEPGSRLARRSSILFCFLDTAACMVARIRIGLEEARHSRYRQILFHQLDSLLFPCDQDFLEHERAA